MIAPASLRFAYRHFRASFWSMALSMIAVALGVALVVAVRLMNGTVLQGFLDTVDATAGRAALIVGGDEGTSFPDDIVARVAAVPGVRLAVPLVRGVTFPNDDSGELLTVHGVDLANDDAVRVYHVQSESDAIVEDLVEFLNQPDSILLGRQFAESRNLSVGASIELVTPVGVRPFTVRGLLDPQGTARVLQGRLVVMDVYAAQPLFAAPGQVNQIDVLIEDGRDVEDVRKAVATVLPSGLRVEEPEVRRQVLRRAVAAFQLMLTAFSLLAMMAGFVVCYGRLQGLMEARTWEIGLLRSVGLRRFTVFSELLKEAALLGVGGVLIGIPIGVLLAQFSLPVLAQTTALNFSMPVPEVKAPALGTAPLFGAAVGLLAALAAATVPALKLARSSPVASISMRGRETPPVAHFGARTVGVLILGIAVLALTQEVLGVPALGLASTAMMVLAAAACASLLIKGVTGWLTRHSRHLGPVTRLVVAHFERAPRGTAFTVTTIGIGLGTVIMVGTLGWSFEQSLVSMLTNRYTADLIITSAFVRGGYESAPLSDAVVRRLRAFDGVLAVAGEQHRRIVYRDRGIILAAFDARCFKDTVVCNWPISSAVEGALELVAEGTAVMVSPAVVRQLRVQEGDRIQLQSPSGTTDLLIAAVTPGQPESAIVLSRELYARLWDDHLVTWVHVRATKRMDAGALASRIRSELGSLYRLRVYSSAQMIQHFAGQVREAFGLQYLLQTVTLVLVLVGVGDTLAAAVLSRRHQFGMMRAVGLKRRQLFGLVMLEGVSVGLLGVLLAAGLGMALSAFWVGIQFPSLLGWTLELHIPIGFSALIATLTVALCMMGALIPSVRAAVMLPIAVLRSE